MISADVFFLFYLITWGFIGTSRGWVREVIVTFAMLFALFIYQLPQYVNLTQPLVNQGDAMWRFFWSAAPFLLITFFGYLSPIVARGRFQITDANRFEYSLLSFLVGAFNGYVLFSSLAWWALNAGLLDAQPSLFTPPPGGWNNFFFIKSAAPVIFDGSLLIFVVIIIFLFVIIVLV